MSVKRGYGEAGFGSGPMKRSKNEKPRVRLLVSSRVAGSIIGKSGVNIQKLRSLRSESNVSVRVPDCPGPERVMTVEADDQDAVIAVVEESLPFMSEEAARSRPGHNPRSFGRDIELRVLVQQSIVGGVIGKSGYKIKEIREVSGASVKIYQTCAPQSTERIVSLQGAPEKVILALGEVFKVLSENEVKGNEAPYDPINFDGFYSAEYGGYGTEADVVGCAVPQTAGFGPPGGDFYRNGRSAAGGFGRGDFGGSGPRGFGQDLDFGFAKFGGLDDDDDDDDKETTQVTIPKDSAGAIIGPSGSRIRKIRADSRASISISEAEAGSNGRVISISGTAPQIESAQFLLQQCVREFGGSAGASSGGGGGGRPYQGFGGRGRF